MIKQLKFADLLGRSANSPRQLDPVTGPSLGEPLS